MSKTSFLYHIIIRTKNNQKTLSIENAEELYKFIWGVIDRKNCKLYRINGVEDHIHMLVSIHPSIAVADFVREVKRSSSILLKTTKGYERFKSWSEGYGGFTYNIKDKEMIINYIKNQRDHHRKVSFKEEIEKILKEYGLDFDQIEWS